LPRSALQSAFDGVVWLYVLFEPFTAYTINQTIMRFVAFLGMFLLLKHHVIKHDHKRIITIGVALGFALLPFWPSGALSLAGLLLALLIILVILNKGIKSPLRYFIYLFLMVFISSFILTFLFFLGIMGIIWLIDWIKYKKVNITFLSSIAGMIAFYLIKNYMLIYSMFVDSKFVSHCDEMVLEYKVLNDTLELCVKSYTVRHLH